MVNSRYESLTNPYGSMVNSRYDLGIMITKDLKCSKQYLNTAKAANKILGMIKRNFILKFKEIILVV